MSIVRYTNKKTGRVALYESTSHYDPVTKSSRPVRKYLGTEDPVTGELIPSSGQRGRKKGATESSGRTQQNVGEDYRLQYEKAKRECAELRNQMAELEHKNKLLIGNLERLSKVINGMLSMATSDSSN